jgi:hypothetical protein
MLEHDMSGSVFVDKAELARGMTTEALRRFNQPFKRL